MLKTGGFASSPRTMCTIEHRQGCRTGVEKSWEKDSGWTGAVYSFAAWLPVTDVTGCGFSPNLRGLPTLAKFFGVIPVTAVAEKTVYVSKRDLVDAS